MAEDALACLVIPSMFSHLWRWFFQNHILFSLFVELLLGLAQVLQMCFYVRNVHITAPIWSFNEIIEEFRHLLTTSEISIRGGYRRFTASYLAFDSRLFFPNQNVVSRCSLEWRIVLNWTNTQGCTSLWLGAWGDIYPVSLTSSVKKESISGRSFFDWTFFCNWENFNALTSCWSSRVYIKVYLLVLSIHLIFLSIKVLLYIHLN